MQTATAKRFNVHPHQLRTLQSKARFVLMAAGTGGGKTYIGPIWLYARIAERPDCDALVVAPTHRILTNVTIPMLCAHFQETKLSGELREAKGQYMLPTGRTIFLASADNPHSFAGHHVWPLWADEAGQFPRMAWVEMQARVGQKRGRVLFTSTPYGLNWLYSEVFKRWQEGNPDYDVIQFASGDSPWYSQEEYNRAKREMPPALFAMRYEGQFTRSEGLVYPDFHRCVVDEASPTGELIGGADFGFRNATAIYKATLDADDCLWITAERYVTESSVASHGDWMGTEHQYVGDPAAAQFIAELQQQGVYITPAVNDIEAGITAVTERVRSGRLKVLRSACSNLIDEAETYRYDSPTETNEARGAKPVKVKDHGMDALRYLCLWLKSRAAERPYFSAIA